MQTETAQRSPFNGSPRPGPHDLRSIALLLDVDGTIIDMAITPGSVTVSDSLRKSLSELHKRCDGALALVSGRLIRDIDNLFAPLRLPAVGGHGAEVRPTADSAIFARTADAIGDSLRKLVIAAASVDPRVIVEDKTSSLAVHYRLAPHMEQPLKTKIAAIVARLGLGTINHTLLTVRQAKVHGLKIAGLVLNDTAGGHHGLAEKTNIRVLPALCKVPLLGVMPHGRAADFVAIRQISNCLLIRRSAKVS